MKYIVILGDGMSDYPFPPLGNKTPLDLAKKPTIDYMASKGILGTAKTVPEGMPPGSDTANLSVMGYSPKIYYSGRSPLEAASIGVDLAESDVTFRCNFITLAGEGDYENKTIIDHSSDEITTEEASVLLDHLRTELFNKEKNGKDFDLDFYVGTSYRHLLVWHDGPFDWQMTPPHDILEKKTGEYLPKGSKSSFFIDIMKKSYELMSVHPINIARVSRGLKPANSMWIWGEGKKPLLSSFPEKYGINGSVISAVDLIKGLGICAGLDSISVEGATGNMHTNFEGKAAAAFKALKDGNDFIYVHVEAPDECGHRNEAENKVLSIEYLSERVVKPLKEALDADGMEYRMLIMPDHATPLELRTHTSDPVPFLIYQNTNEKPLKNQKYNESDAIEANFHIEDGWTLMDYFIKNSKI